MVLAETADLRKLRPEPFPGDAAVFLARRLCLLVKVSGRTWLVNVISMTQGREKCFVSHDGPQHHHPPHDVKCYKKTPVVMIK
jgi:hypothetical protein